MPRALRLKAPPVWLEAEGAKRSAATIGSITAAATASSSEARSARPRRAAATAGPRPSTARLQALARQLALGRPVVAQRHDELVRPETPIMRIWSVDVRSDAGVEFVHQPSDRTARRPLSVRPAIAGRDLDRHHREAPLRLSRQRRRGNGIRALDGANARSAGERQHQAARAPLHRAQVRPQGAPAAASRIRAWQARSCGCVRQ